MYLPHFFRLVLRAIPVFFLLLSGANAGDHPLIAFLSDYGLQDACVAQVKGTIYSISPHAEIVDLTHMVTPSNVAEGAYLLNQSSPDYPIGTIFIASVDPRTDITVPPILVKTKAYRFYLAPDNGLLTHVIAREGFLHAWRLENREYFRNKNVPSDFRGRDILGPVAAYLSLGVNPELMGTEIALNNIAHPYDHPVTFSGNLLSLQVLHVNHFGNVITNLSHDDELAAKLHEGALVKIIVNKETFSAPFVKGYGDASKDRLTLLYGNNNLLEISKIQGSAARELKVESGQTLFLKP